MSTRADIAALLKSKASIETGEEEIQFDITPQFNDTVVASATNNIIYNTNTLDITDDSGTTSLKTYFNKINSVVKDIVSALTRIISYPKETTRLNTSQMINVTSPVTTSVSSEETTREKEEKIEEKDSKNRNILRTLISAIKAPGAKTTAMNVAGIAGGALIALIAANKDKIIDSFSQMIDEIKENAKTIFLENDIVKTIKDTIMEIFNTSPDKESTESVETKMVNNSVDFSGVKPEYQEYIKNASKETGIDEATLAGIIQTESGFDPYAESAAGAKGMMQFMPDTWKEWGGGKDIYDPEANIMAGARYFKWLLNRHNGNVDEALAAYNYGTGNVNKKKSTYGEDWLKFTPEETQKYIIKNKANREAFLQSSPDDNKAIVAKNDINLTKVNDEVKEVFNPSLKTEETESTQVAMEMPTDSSMAKETDETVLNPVINNTIIDRTISGRKDYILSPSLNSINHKRT